MILLERYYSTVLSRSRRECGLVDKNMDGTLFLFRIPWMERDKFWGFIFMNQSWWWLADGVQWPTQEVLFPRIGSKTSTMFHVTFLHPLKFCAIDHVNVQPLFNCMACVKTHHWIIFASSVLLHFRKPNFWFSFTHHWRQIFQHCTQNKAKTQKSLATLPVQAIFTFTGILFAGNPSRGSRIICFCEMNHHFFSSDKENWFFVLAFEQSRVSASSFGPSPLFAFTQDHCITHNFETKSVISCCPKAWCVWSHQWTRRDRVWEHCEQRLTHSVTSKAQWGGKIWVGEGTNRTIIMRKDHGGKFDAPSNLPQSSLYSFERFQDSLWFPTTASLFQILKSFKRFRFGANSFQRQHDSQFGISNYSTPNCLLDPWEPIHSQGVECSAAAKYTSLHSSTYVCVYMILTKTCLCTPC